MSEATDILLRDVRHALNAVNARLDGRVLVDAKEAARRLGVSRRWLADLDVPSVKIGSRRLYRAESLEQWAREREAEAMAQVH